MSTINGIVVIESVYAMTNGAPVTTRRAWRERLFTLPWRPWIATTMRTPMVPGFFQMADGRIVAHPAALAQLRAELERIDAWKVPPHVTKADLERAAAVRRMYK